jgi:hypothetical protein
LFRAIATNDARKVEGGTRKIPIGDRHQLTRALAIFPKVRKDSLRIYLNPRRDGESWPRERRYPSAIAEWFEVCSGANHRGAFSTTSVV